MAAISTSISLNASPFLEGIKAVDRSVQDVSSKIRRFGRNFAGIAAAVGAATLAVRSFASGISGALSAASETEDLETSFSTLLGGADEARERIAELSRFAAATPFELPEIARASKVLQTLTQGALATGDGLRLVGDVAASTGQPFAEIAVHIGRMYDGLQNGRPVGESMNRLQELGIVSSMARSRIEELQKAGLKGSAVWSVATAEFSRFSGEMDKRSATWSGVVSTLADGWKALQRAMGAPLAAALKPVLQDLTESLEGMEPKAAKVGAAIASFASGCVSLAKGAGAAISVLAQFAPVLAALAVSMLATRLNARLAGTALATSFNGLTVAVRAMQGSLALGRNAMAALMSPLASLNAAGRALRATFGASMWTSFSSGATAAFRSVGRGIKGMFTMLYANMGTIVTALAFAGFSYIQDRIAQVEAAMSRVKQDAGAGSTSVRRGIKAFKDVSSEEEREQTLKHLEAEIEAAEERLDSARSEVRKSAADQHSFVGAVRAQKEEQLALARQSVRINEDTIRSLQALKDETKGLTPEQLRAVAAAKKFENALSDANKKAEETRKTIASGMEELAKAKADDALKALSLIQQRMELLRRGNVGSSGEAETELGFLESRRMAGTLSDGGAERMAKLLAIRKDLLPVERQITEERRRQAELAQDRAEKAAKDLADAKAEVSKFERGFGLEVQKLLAEARGDKEGAAKIERQQRRDSYVDEFRRPYDQQAEKEREVKRQRIIAQQMAGGKTERDAERFADRQLAPQKQQDDAAALARAGRLADAKLALEGAAQIGAPGAPFQAIGDSDRRVGLGGNAFGGSKADPIKDNGRKMEKLSAELAKLTTAISKEKPKAEAGYPVFK